MVNWFFVFLWDGCVLVLLQGGGVKVGGFFGLWGAPSSLLVFGALPAVAFGLWGAPSLLLVFGALPAVAFGLLGA
ncbi:MAG TPA: hypothetical protein ENK85_00380, partial [Saprospiraceae bacterium]|nr:hypothetical protein [Saprospiraceae bacterium]